MRTIAHRAVHRPNICLGSQPPCTSMHFAITPSPLVSSKHLVVSWCEVYNLISWPRTCMAFAISTINLSAPPIPRSGWMIIIFILFWLDTGAEWLILLQLGLRTINLWLYVMEEFVLKIEVTSNTDNNENKRKQKPLQHNKNKPGATGNYAWHHMSNTIQKAWYSHIVLKANFMLHISTNSVWAWRVFKPAVQKRNHTQTIWWSVAKQMDIIKPNILLTNSSTCS